jgi:predicted metal-binding membrane protein
VRTPLRFEPLLRRPELGVLAAALVLAGLGWWQLAAPAAGSNVAAHGAHAALHGDIASGFGLMLMMWLSMTVAMMLPTAAPAILAYAGITGNAAAGSQRPAPLTAFVGGYLVVWAGFGLLASVVQWSLVALAPRVPALEVHGSSALAGGLLAAAGLYQFSALKSRCLSRCRSPLAFFLAHWREGVRGAFDLGRRHGVHCLGCCWALMTLMLIGGAMSLAWTAAMAALLLAEKLAPRGALFGRVVGAGLIGWGGALLAIAFANRV